MPQKNKSDPTKSQSWRLSPDDKLGSTNITKQIQFFEDDLFQAQLYYKKLQAWDKAGVKVPSLYWVLAKRDIADANANLDLVKKKLKK